MSFSLETKTGAIAWQMKKPCCRRAFINGVLLCAAELSDSEVTLYLEGQDIVEFCAKIIREQFGRDAAVEKGVRGVLLVQFSSKSAAEFLRSAMDKIDTAKIIKCDECVSSFVRGLFVGGGTVNSPHGKNYQVEIKSRLRVDFGTVVDILSDADLPFKVSDRFENPSIYLKSSAKIEDFLFYIGANKQAFDFANARISHEIKNSINRRTNCETSNIARATSSAAKHIAAIKFLVERGRLSELGSELEYTARMRLEHPEMSLSQLGQTMTPTVSKPGLYHRLEKICVFSENIKSKEV